MLNWRPTHLGAAEGAESMITAMPRVLLVEDDPSDRELVRRVLGKNGFPCEIHEARDGEEALDFIFGKGDHSGNHQVPQLPSLVLLDLHLPKVDGLEVLRVVKRDSRTRGIPIVIMSSSKEPEDLIRCYREGANSCVQKPIDFDQYREVLAAVSFYWLRINQPAPTSLALAQDAQPEGPASETLKP